MAAGVGRSSQYVSTLQGSVHSCPHPPDPPSGTWAPMHKGEGSLTPTMHTLFPRSLGWCSLSWKTEWSLGLWASHGGLASAEFKL
jgi:hypothetical protein